MSLHVCRIRNLFIQASSFIRGFNKTPERHWGWRQWKVSVLILLKMLKTQSQGCGFVALLPWETPIRKVHSYCECLTDNFDNLRKTFGQYKFLSHCLINR